MLLFWALVACNKEEPEEDTAVVLYEEPEDERTDAPDSLDEALAVEICYAPDDCLDWPNVLHEDAIDEPGDRDWLSLELEEGWIVTLGTAAWYLDDDTEPDTVIRLYDEAGDLIATNDDMPFSWRATDSALYVQALYTGTYYLEVLEYSDYSSSSSGLGDDSERLGGSSWGYEVWGFAFSYDDDLVLENNTIDAVVGQDQERFAWWTDTAGDNYGTLGQKGDVDVREWSFEEDWLYTWSFYPGTLGTLTPTVSLYTSDGTLVAQTDQPAFDFDGGHILPNVGLLYHCKAGESYYAVVEDAAGAYGVGTFYSMFDTGYVVENLSETFVVEADPDVNDDFGTAERFNPVESSTYENLNYMYAKGSVGPTDVDYWYVADSDLSLGTQDQYINVWVQALGIGGLADVKVVVYDASGAVIGEASVDPDPEDYEEDPELLNVELSAGGAYVAVEVEDHQGTDASSGTYLLEAWVYSEPI